jgi:NADH-quinone oxidoreductase subunit G
MPDSHRLNYTYIHREDRFQEPVVKHESVRWNDAVTAAAQALKAAGNSAAILASGRMTNEELFLAKRLAASLGTEFIDIKPRPQQGDGFLISDDGNPNTSGAKLLGVASSNPGSRLAEISSGIASGRITTLLTIGENPLESGISEADLAKLSSLIVLDILPNASTRHASVILPGSAAYEKRGSMVNVKGRLQRLNRAVTAPGHARSDWEVLADLLKALGQESASSIEDLFKQMAATTPAFAGLNLGKIGDQGVDLKL